MNRIVHIFNNSKSTKYAIFKSNEQSFFLNSLNATGYFIDFLTVKSVLKISKDNIKDFLGLV